MPWGVGRGRRYARMAYHRQKERERNPEPGQCQAVVGEQEDLLIARGRDCSQKYKIHCTKKGTVTRRCKLYCAKHDPEREPRKKK